MHLFPLFRVGLKVRCIYSMPFICLSYRRKHNLSACHRLYTVHSKTTLFKLFLAAFLQLGNPELCGLSDACTCSLITGTGSPTGNEINKNNIPKQKVQQRLGFFSGEITQLQNCIYWMARTSENPNGHCLLSLTVHWCCGDAYFAFLPAFFQRNQKVQWLQCPPGSSEFCVHISALL